MGFEDLSIDVFLEGQNKRYNQILYLIDYVVPGLLSGKIIRFPGKWAKTLKDPGSLTGTQVRYVYQV